jgi:lipopolysaccharide export system permease protein
LIIRRYIARELLWTLVAVTSVLYLVYVSNRFVRYLADAATGALPADMVAWLLFLKSLAALPTLLPLAFYLSVLLALGRLYKDSEMTALAACGVGLGNVLQAVLMFALMVGAAILAMSLYMTPWAQRQSDVVRKQAEAQAQFAGIASGRFNEAAKGSLVFYTERVSRDQREMENVFAQGVRDGTTVLLSARQAHQHIDEATGQRFLVFQDGYRYDGNPGEANFKIVQFREHGVLLQRPEVLARSQRYAGQEVSELWGNASPGAAAELQWRLAMPLSAVVMSLLAVVMARTDPRQGRYAKLFLAILVYAAYSNLLGIARSWIERGVTPAALGLWWVHGLSLVVFVLAYLRESSLSRSWRQLLFRR